MGERSERSIKEIERDIARARADLALTVEALETTVHDRLDWRRPIREHPLAAVGLALAFGLMLGAR